MPIGAMSVSTSLILLEFLNFTIRSNTILYTSESVDRSVAYVPRADFEGMRTAELSSRQSSTNPVVSPVVELHQSTVVRLWEAKIRKRTDLLVFFESSTSGPNYYSISVSRGIASQLLYT